MTKPSRKSSTLTGNGGTADRVARQIYDMIRRRELRPGDAVREQALADRFGVSRGPVREALRSLAARGMVSLETNKGASIARPSDEEMREVIDIGGAMMKLAGSKAAEGITPDAGARILKKAKELQVLAPTDIAPMDFLQAQGRCLEEILLAANAPRVRQLVHDYIFFGPGSIYTVWSLTTPTQRQQSATRWMKAAQMVADGQPQKAEQAFDRIHKAGLDIVLRLVGAGLKI